METNNLARGSAALAELARRLGVNVKDPVSYDPETRRFYTVEDSARERTTIDHAHLNWLLDLGQRDADALTPVDDAMLASFLWAHTTAKWELDALCKLGREMVSTIRSFVVERTPFEVPLSDARRVVECSGSFAIPSIITQDWKTAFRLRAADLVAEYSDRIRVCQRPDCGRLFLASDKRQVFCSRPCSQQAQFEKYVKKIGGQEKRREEQREQYKKRKRAAAKRR